MPDKDVIFVAKQKPVKVFFTYDRSLDFDEEKTLRVIEELINRIKKTENKL